MKTFLSALAIATVALTASADQASAQDVTKVAPGTSTVVFENEFIRVVKAHFAPRAKEAPHTHPAGWYYVTMGGTLNVEAGGKVDKWTAPTGHSEWSDGEGLHTAVNRGRKPMEYLLVEVKAAPSK